eukprot:66362-Ditylum_brightwellii.AAC.1
MKAGDGSNTVGGANGNFFIFGGQGSGVLASGGRAGRGGDVHIQGGQSIGGQGGNLAFIGGEAAKEGGRIRLFSGAILADQGC